MSRMLDGAKLPPWLPMTPAFTPGTRHLPSTACRFLSRRILTPSGGIAMISRRRRWLMALACALFACCGPHAIAGDTTNKKPPQAGTTALPESGQIKSLEIFPNQVALKGIDDSQQLIVTAE